MKQIEKPKAIEILTALDNRRYIDFIAASEQAHIKSDFYISSSNGSDFIAHLKCGTTFHEYYFSLSCDKNIKFLCQLIKTREKVFQDFAMLYSYNEGFYKNSSFSGELFEILDRHIEKKYGYFNKPNPQILLPENDEITEMTLCDIDIIENFAKENEEYFPSYELLNYNDSLKNKSDIHKIYGYFKNGKLTAFVTVHAVNENYWNIGYIFT